MASDLHGSVRTTSRIRAELKATQAPTRLLAGLSHLTEDGAGEFVRPSRSFALSSDRYVWSCGTQHVQRQLTQCREILRPMITPVPRAVLVETNVEAPVQGDYSAVDGWTHCWKTLRSVDGRLSRLLLVLE